MAGLLDFLQAASNSAAGTVTAPVDGIAWLLRKAGIPVGEPVGGSDWAKRQGLMRDVPQSAASVAGETFGLLSPVVAAAKAPQIAKGLLQMGENAAKPRTLNPQTGAIVWHGSPHKFDRFDSSKIGTGEGAQAYGHGLYLAESPKVADEYAGKLSKKAVEIKGFVPQTQAEHELMASLGARANSTQYGSGASSVLNDLRSLARNGTGERKSAAERALAALGDFRLPSIVDSGNLYKVDLPDSAIARMLDWDKPLSEQAPEFQDLLRKADLIDESVWPHYTGQQLYEGEMNARGPWKQNGFADNAAAPPISELLKAQGIPGIRYLDSGSRGAGTGTSNFVVFPGEEGLLKILERNGIPLR